ncbi:40S ribosomal protein S28-like [Trichosurus vulpecula]|uniref:40S ribosomal protein S28-like n=1 Tax=Trichosurus vulpecula TaxID=9337 RepID=UPI00186AD9FA|nr:40S ribosomal protein S28-like [Trichosurus vulpecula]
MDTSHAHPIELAQVTKVLVRTGPPWHTEFMEDMSGSIITNVKGPIWEEDRLTLLDIDLEAALRAGEALRLERACQRILGSPSKCRLYRPGLV